MTKSMLKNGTVGLLLAGGLAAGFAAAVPAPVGAARPSHARTHARVSAARASHAPVAAAEPSHAPGAPGATLNLSQGRGQLIRLRRPITDVFVADDKIADVQVRSPTIIYVFGKGPGITTISATDKAGTVVYGGTVQVGANYDRLSEMLRLAMPDSHITVTTMNGLILLTGTVASPDDVAQASLLVASFTGVTAATPGTSDNSGSGVGDIKGFIINRLKTAVPLQVNLQVKIAEVNRNFVKSVGMNLLTRDTSGGFMFGIAQGNAGTIQSNTSVPSTSGACLGCTVFTPNAATGATSLAFMGHALGMDLLSTIDLAENDGLAHTLAEPNLTAMSGETASFLAGGEIPIPVPAYQGVTTIEYKNYGVSLAFTPTVLADGRISMRVRPEVSTLTSSTVSINGYNIPGLQTRRAETTIELGSGQSFMIGGLLNNSNTSTLQKAPFLGDLPILGALFRSQSFRREETELVIIVTPYLVKPVDANAIKLPTDGYKAATDLQRFIGGQTFSGKSGEQRPVPTPSTVPPATPTVTGSATDPKNKDKNKNKTQPVQPGFALND